MPTITVSPASDSDAEKLNQLSTAQREFYYKLNETRWENFEEREKLFEKTLSDTPESPLPESTQQILLKSNAQDWAQHVLQAVKTGHLSRMKSSDIISTDNLWFDKTALADPIGRFPKLCVSAASLEYTEDKIRLASKEDTIVFDIIEGSDHIDSLYDSPLYIYEASDNFIIEPYEINSDPTQSLPRKEKPEQEDFEAVLRTLSVAASVTPVAQVEPRKENEAFPSLFQEVGLFWTEVETNDEEFDTYLVGTKKRGKQRIQEFLSTKQQDRSVNDYFQLLGYPVSVTEYYCDKDWTTKEYDRYSAEEFAIYAWLEGELKEEDMQYILYSPYRPPPDTKEIKYAIQFAKQFQEGLKILYNEAPSEEDYDKLMKYYDSHNKQKSLIRDKPILELYNWLVPCEATPRLTQNHK